MLVRYESGDIMVSPKDRGRLVVIDRTGQSQSSFRFRVLLIIHMQHFRNHIPLCELF